MQFAESLTLKEIAGLLNAEFDGDESMLISGINEIYKVQKGDITFVDFEKYYDRALNSNASVIIINQKIEKQNGKAFIFSDDPFRDFNRLTARFAPFVSCNKMICDTAMVGKGTILQPGVFLGKNVKIGKNCVIHANVSINANATIGDNVIIHANTVIGTDAFYFKTRKIAGKKQLDKLLSSGRVIIHDDVEIGASCTIDRGVSGDTIIGKGTKLDNQVHVGHGTEIGENCLIAAQVGISGKVIIEDEVTLWGQVGVSKDLRIGKGAILYAQSGVSKSLPGGKTYFGSPAREAKYKMREMAVVAQLAKYWDKILGNLR